jgi:hypothetical protein
MADEMADSRMAGAVFLPENFCLPVWAHVLANRPQDPLHPAFNLAINSLAEYFQHWTQVFIGGILLNLEYL